MNSDLSSKENNICILSFTTFIQLQMTQIRLVIALWETEFYIYILK